MNVRTLASELVALVVAITQPVFADEMIGTVERVQNFAAAISGGGDRILALGDPIFANNRVFTGEVARLVLSFADQTNLTLGDKAALEIDSFVFDGSGGEASWDLLAGAFAMTTGLIGKDDPAGVVVTTPVSTIGIRGTTFWGGLISDDLYGVLILDGAVEVRTVDGTVVLDDVGEGTKISLDGGEPTAAAVWGNELVARALASITFEETP